jgi:predicted nucleic acid-binding protein
MKYLVDANVLSEATRARPDPTVVAWLDAHEPELAIDAIVLGELAVGVAALHRGRKRSRPSRISRATRFLEPSSGSRLTA